MRSICVKAGKVLTVVSRNKVAAALTAAWMLLGAGAMSHAVELPHPQPVEWIDPQLPDTKSARVTVNATYTFTQPGTYFPVLRATSLRDSDPASAYGRVRNLGRVRV